ncbi:hypothetical protein MMC27_005290 [Xylographa pallens]|nr:hypothetical protein [Xylographa pallens]
MDEQELEWLSPTPLFDEGYRTVEGSVIDEQTNVSKSAHVPFSKSHIRDNPAASKKQAGPGYTPLFPLDLFSNGHLHQAVSSEIETTPQENSARKNRRKWTGWRVGVAASACAAGAICILNTVLTIWAWSHFPMNSGIGTLSDDCGTSKTWALWLHLAINVLSTILLGASNYTMQCLLAPTRKEVDRCHQVGEWLAIGTPTFRNISAVSTKRRMLFILLTISSAPLHLMYNSAIFETITARVYSVVVVSETFLNGDHFNDTIHQIEWGSYSVMDENKNPHTVDGWRVDVNATQLKNTSVSTLLTTHAQLQRLSSSDCMTAYGNDLVRDRGSLLAVTNGPLVNMSLGAANSSVYGFYNFQLSKGGSWTDPLAWICGFMNDYDARYQACDIQKAQATASNWTIFDQPIKYCLSQEKQSICNLEFSLTIMMIVIACNFVKATCMVLHAWGQDEDILITFGDAAASFMERSDPTTKGFCLSPKATFKQVFNNEWHLALFGQVDHRMASPFVMRRTSWFHACMQRWIVTMLLCTAALIVCGGFLGKSLEILGQSGSTSFRDLWKIGFGAVDPRSLLSIGNSVNKPVVSMAVVANIPQLFLTALYFTYNAMFTVMLSENEWQRFSLQRKTLRVTSPRGGQRGTYFLSLPYCYAGPLMVVSAIMHWLCSQAFFFAHGFVQDDDGNPVASDDFTTCGWSSIAVVFIILVGSLMLLTAAGIGFRKIKGVMPLAGGCSAVISAACHPTETGKDQSVLPLLWGAVDEGEGIGHCALSGGEVLRPVLGRLYAGID